MLNTNKRKCAKLAASLTAGKLYRVPYSKAKRSLRSHSFGHTLTPRRGVVKVNANKKKHEQTYEQYKKNLNAMYGHYD